jgi:hypothetical protein
MKKDFPKSFSKKLKSTFMRYLCSINQQQQQLKIKMTNAQSKNCFTKEDAVATEFAVEMRPWIKEQIHALKAHKLMDWQFEAMMDLIDTSVANGWGKEMIEIICEVENERRLAGLSYTNMDSDDETE